MEDQARLNKKKKNNEELRVFFDKYHQETREAQQKQQKEDAQQLAEYIKIRDDALAEKEAIRLKKLETGKKYQDDHLKQIVIMAHLGRESVTKTCQQTQGP